MEKQSDRVNYGESMKLNIGDYESYSFNLSLSTDVRPNETKEDAMLRARKFVKRQIRDREKKIRKWSRKFVDFDTLGKLK